MKATLVYSSLTGNTLKVAKAIYEACDEITNMYSVKDKDIHIDENDVLVVCYWNSKGTADVNTINFLKQQKGKKIIAVGTLGAYPDSEHAVRMKARVKQLIEENGNEWLADFCCQGKIDPARTERRLAIPEGQPHHLDEEGYKRHLESRKHPNEEDLRLAIEVVKNAFQKL